MSPAIIDVRPGGEQERNDRSVPTTAGVVQRRTSGLTSKIDVRAGCEEQRNDRGVSTFASVM